MDDSLSAVFRIGDELLCVKGHQSTSLQPCTITELDSYENSIALLGQHDFPRELPEKFNFNLGPVAGGLLESVKMNVYTDGERIVEIRPDPSFKNRNIHMRKSGIDEALLKMERVNGVYAASFGTAFCLAVEEIQQSPADYDTQLTRILISELERITNHIHVIAKLSEGASQNVATQHLFSLEERVRRIISEYFGHRFFYGLNSIGGLEREVNTNGLGGRISSVVDEFNSIWDALASSRLFLDRLQTTCFAKKEWTVGPVVRAADFKYDARLSGYLPYADIGFEVASDDTGDVLSRALVRQHEVEISSRMIEEICRKVRKVGKKRDLSSDKNGWSVKRVETPGGDMILFLGISGGFVTDFGIRSASMANILAFAKGATSGILTDFTFAWESFGFWISEMGDYI